MRSDIFVQRIFQPDSPCQLIYEGSGQAYHTTVFPGKSNLKVVVAEGIL